MKLTASQKLKQYIIYKATEERIEDGATIDATYDNEYVLHDAESELRHSGEQTDLSSKEYSRHYDNYEVAKEMLDGSFVGWTYWFGGGKHGEPYSIEWIEHAYDVVYGEETRTVKVWRKL